jgi:hypothetical protein
MTSKKILEKLEELFEDTIPLSIVKFILENMSTSDESMFFAELDHMVDREMTLRLK